MPESLVYVGTYTVRGSQGIYAYSFDSDSGNLRLLGLAAETTNPTFLAVDRPRSLVYAVEETSEYKNQPSGALRAYTADLGTGGLTLLNEVASKGTGPCYIAFDKTGRYLLTANYHGGSIAIFPRLEDGRLGQASAFVQHKGGRPFTVRQQVPHAHAICTSPDNKLVVVADLGLDKVLLYRFDETTGSLADGEATYGIVEEGAGPRHLAFHPNGRFVYVLNELASTVTQFAFDAATASLQTVRTVSGLPEGFGDHSDAAHLQLEALGRFLYISNRGHDSIAVFAIDTLDGTLKVIQHISTQGKTPRGFVLDPSGQWLLAGNQDTDSVAVFRISRETGELAFTRLIPGVPSPAFLIFP
ncbi:MAG: lactonase family protein [Acidobacteriaceae bacterium]